MYTQLRENLFLVARPLNKEPFLRPSLSSKDLSTKSFVFAFSELVGYFFAPPIPSVIALIASLKEYSSFFEDKSCVQLVS